MSSSTARFFPGTFGKRITSSHANAQSPQASPTETASAERLGQPGPTTVPDSTAAAIVASLGTPSDEALIAQICEGSREALAVLFRRHASAVRAVTYRVLRDTSEAEDMVQDVFLLVNRACQAFDSSKGPARFWILQMAYHRAISRRRYLTSRHFYTRLDLDGAASELADLRTKASRFENSIDGRLGNGGLERVFEALSENQRQTLRLYFFEGYTFEEIATKLGQSKGNIRHHYFRGLNTLRKLIFDRELQRH
jgi:RNA polymerase sigma-70 factor (ECF subfamily)